MDVYLSPHNDDDALFGAYTCLRYKPKIITVLRSHVEASWWPPIHYEQREAESAAAAEILGCEYEQWEYPDNAPPWGEIAARLRTLEADRVWAPLHEQDGHAHHNCISFLAADVFPDVRYYATYTYGGGKSTVGELVEPEPGWEAVKREAMSCYLSQANHPNTHLPFTTWAIDEYLT